MTEVVVTTGAIIHAKHQSTCDHQQTNTHPFYRPDDLPVAQITATNSLRFKSHFSSCTQVSQQYQTTLQYSHKQYVHQTRGHPLSHCTAMFTWLSPELINVFCSFLNILPDVDTRFGDNIGLYDKQSALTRRSTTRGRHSHRPQLWRHLLNTYKVWRCSV